MSIKERGGFNRNCQKVKDSRVETIRNTTRDTGEYLLEMVTKGDFSICKDCYFFSSCLLAVLNSDQESV